MRRSAIALIIPLALGLLVAPLTVEAQQAGPVHRIGLLHPFSPPPPSASDARAEALRQGLHDFGYVEGQNFVMEIRYAAGSEERLRDLAAELVQLKVDVLVAPGAAASRAAQHATRTIPIVMAGTFDPVGGGFVASLAQPGGQYHGLELSGGRAPREAAGTPQGDGAPEHAHRRVGVSGLARLCVRAQPPDRGRADAGAPPARCGGAQCGRVGPRLYGDDQRGCGGGPRNGGRPATQ